MEEDAELARRCRRGDNDAWESLVKRHHRQVWRVAYSFVGRAEEADELTQEIFIRVVEGLASFDLKGNFPAWLGRVARNHCIDHYRRRKLERALTVEERSEAVAERIPNRSDDPARRLEQKDLAAWIQTALKRLPDELREAVRLRDLQDMTYEEMAELLEVPLGTVKSRLNRGRLELARLLRLRRREWNPAWGGEPQQ